MHASSVAEQQTPRFPIPVARPARDHLVGILEAIAGASRSDELLCRLGERLRQLLEVDATGWALVGADGALQPTVIDVTGVVHQGGWPAAADPMAWALAMQEPVVVPDVGLEPRWPHAMLQLRSLGLAGVRMLPLTTARRRVGVLLLGQRYGSRAALDAPLLREATRVIAATLDHLLRLEVEQAASEREHLRLLLEVGRTLGAGDALPAVLATLTDVLARLLPGARARLALREAGGGAVVHGPAHLGVVLRLPLCADDRQLGTLDVGGIDAVPSRLLPLLEAIATLAAPAVARLVAAGGREPWDHIVGASPVLRRALRQVEIVAPTDATVLLLGETGTGKELMARSIHERSGRKGRPFVKINCAAIPSGLLESELFGHEKGAFTSAVAQKIGRFEIADGGTLFLDEVGEIPLELQSKLLRVLQEQEFERLGGTRTIKVDVRLVAATNRDLGAMVEEHRFRDDLYYRLNVFPLAVPPLRERPEDIEPLVRHFVARFAQRMQRRVDEIPGETIAALREHPWPGNVRELENLVQRALILSPGPRLVLAPGLLVAPRARAAHEGGATLAGAQRAHILRVLDETNWMLGGPRGAAVRLGMKRTTLQSLLKRLGIHHANANPI